MPQLFSFQRRAPRKKEKKEKKKKTIVISCPYAHPLCVGRIKIKIVNKKTMEKKKKKKNKQPKINLILSHVNHTFLILDSQVETRAFRHTHCTLGKSFF
jgi:hypothetical protein